MAMGQKPSPPVNIPIPTQMGSKMGGAPPPKWDPIGFDLEPTDSSVKKLANGEAKASPGEAPALEAHGRHPWPGGGTLSSWLAKRGLKPRSETTKGYPAKERRHNQSKHRFFLSSFCPPVVAIAFQSFQPWRLDA